MLITAESHPPFVRTRGRPRYIPGGVKANRLSQEARRTGPTPSAKGEVRELVTGEVRRMHLLGTSVNSPRHRPAHSEGAFEGRKAHLHLLPLPALGSPFAVLVCRHEEASDRLR